MGLNFDMKVFAPWRKCFPLKVDPSLKRFYRPCDDSNMFLFLYEIADKTWRYADKH